MPLGQAGDPFTFHVLWLDAEGSPMTVTSPAIDIFYFDNAGDRQNLVTSGVMTAVTGDTGRYAYVYTVSSSYDEPSPVYGLMTATETATGLELVEEMVVDVIDPNASTLTVKNEGVVLNTSVTSIDFIGVDVESDNPSGDAIRVFIPPPSYQSHWNTSDGDNGNQSVTESISRTTTRIPDPSGGEGSPFKTGGWADSNQDTTLSTSATFTTPDVTTGFGGDSTMTVNVYDADGSTVLETFTTAALDGDGSYDAPSGNISVTLSSYGSDTLQWKAKASVVVDFDGVLSDAGLTGGRCHAEVIHTTDSGTDGTGPYTYTQDPFFLDSNPSTPAINGTVSVSETAGQVLTKHLSGVEYYILSSQFTASVTDIDGLNANSIRTSANLVLTGSEYGLSSLSHSPFGTGSANFSGWSSAENQDDVSYSNTAWAITQGSYRYFGSTANISSYPRDPWANGSTQNSSNASILIDTYTSSSSALVENFDDEDLRQDSGFNSGAAAGNWTSTTALVSGEGFVHNGKLMSPEAASYQDWSSFQPSAGGANPDYSALSVPVSYYRTFEDTSGDSRSSFSVVFSGAFVSDATTDLANSDLEIFVRRVSSPLGDSGPSANPLNLHGSLYNFSSFDDGVTNGDIREGSSSGNTVNGTFGGLPCEDGIHVHVRINDATIQIDSMTVTFF